MIRAFKLASTWIFDQEDRILIDELEKQIAEGTLQLEAEAQIENAIKKEEENERRIQENLISFESRVSTAEGVKVTRPTPLSRVRNLHNYLITQLKWFSLNSINLDWFQIT